MNLFKFTRELKIIWKKGKNERKIKKVYKKVKSDIHEC